MENTTLQSTPVFKKGILHYQYRALFGWLDEQLASVVRASFLDDIQENHLLAVAAAKAAVQSRPPFTPASPLVDLEEDYLLTAIRGRAETAYLVREMKWRFAQVNLNEVLTFQPSVRIDNLDNRVPASLLSKEQLYKLCFPSLPSDLIQPDELTLELTDEGYILTTLNPNIHLNPWHKVGSPMIIPQQPLAQAALPFAPEMPSVNVAMLPFVLMKNPGYLQIVQYKDRYFIRDGYHRAAAFLRRGITVVPCIHLEAQLLEEVGLLQPGMFPEEVLFGEHPPRLRDFWDNTVACDSLQPAQRKVFVVGMKSTQVLR